MKYIIGPDELNNSFCNEFEICITKTCGQDCPKQNICVNVIANVLVSITV